MDCQATPLLADATVGRWPDQLPELLLRSRMLCFRVPATDLVVAQFG